MKVSIITPTYNSAACIETALLSILKQTHPDIEHIIIDGESTDGTLESIQKFDGKVRTLISEPDDGIYDAINKGIKRATGDVIGILNADDVLESPETIANIVAQFAQNPIDLLFGDLLYVSAQNLSQVVRVWKSDSFSRTKLKFGWMPPHPTVYVRKEVYQEVGLYNRAYKIAADYDWLLRALTHFWHIHYLPETLVRMRMGGVSNKNAQHILQKMKEDIHALHSNKVGSWFCLFCKNARKLGQFAGKRSAAQHFTLDV